MPSSLRASALPTLLLACVATVLAGRADAAAEGSDLEFGGAGDGAGQFHDLRDIAFDAQDNLYTIEGGTFDAKTGTFTGTCRVQKFDQTGKPLLQFSLRDPAIGENQDPTHIAIDAKGFIYVAQRKAGLIQRFAADGTPAKAITLPDAFAIAPWTVAGHQQLAVVAFANKIVDGHWAKVGGTQIDVITADGVLGTPVPLAHPLIDVDDITTDRNGNVYAVAGIHQLYEFDAKGALLRSIGTGEETRAEDGSELLHTVAVDSTGRVYTMGFGNPGMVVSFSPDFATVTTRPGQYRWADPWSAASQYTPLAIDSHDRLWVGVCHEFTKDNPNYAYYHAAPGIVRAVPDFFTAGVTGITQASTLVLGIKPVVEVGAPNAITYDLKPVPIDIILKKSARQVKTATVSYHIYDMYHADAGHGTVDLPLTDGVEAKEHVDFTPPAYGWYMVSVEVAAQGRTLASISQFLGVTHRYPGMAVLDDGKSKGGMPDAQRQMFSGLLNERLHAGNTKESFDQLAEQIKASQEVGTTWFVQLSDKKDCTPENVRAVVTRFKGQVKVWEIMNEPNFSFGNPAEYVAVLKQAYAIIKEVDPAAKVMGPDVCGIQLGWYEAFYKAGGKDCTDILSEHDYEGHESIDMAHWVWKYGELRKLMAANGDQDKPLWQTERAISGVRGEDFLGATQAVRTTFHRDLLETLGVPPEHNNHFYINDHGFGDCPSFVWSRSGPHPAALALRVRHAMTTGRAYRGTLDFGANGNSLFMGLRYLGDDGSTIILRNLGTLDEAMDIAVTGGNAVTVVDAMGNEQAMTAQGGKIHLTVRQMPTYLRLDKGEDITVPIYDFGRNMAPSATFSYSGGGAGDYSLLNNGIIESIHAGNPHGGNDGKLIWTADFTSGPQNLDIVFDRPRAIDTVILHGVRADNAFCALLDYDLQWFDGTTWATIHSVHTPCPPSEPSVSQMCKYNTWYLDNNLFLDHFPAVTTARLRLVIKRVTHGFVPDDIARAWGNVNPCKVMLREVEVFGPHPAVAMNASLASDGNADATADAAENVTKDVLTVVVANHGTKAFIGCVQALLPTGWTATATSATVTLEAGASATTSFAVTAPIDIPVGAIALDAALLDGAGKQVGFTWATRTIPSPVKLTGQPPGNLDPANQLLGLGVHNDSSVAVSGSAHLDLKGRTTIAPVDVDFGPIGPGAETTVTFKVPGLDLAASTWKAVYTVNANHCVATTAMDLAVRAWSVVGPFPRDFAKDFGPESGVDFTKTFTDQMGNEMKWSVTSTTSEGFVDLARCFNPHENVCAYAVTYVNSPDARDAVLSLGTDDGGKAWVNGKNVHSEDGSHGASPGQFKPPITLKAGWNEILFKITQGGGGWGFFCDVVDAKGVPMADLVYAPRKP